ncbi:hypothetical protein M514_10552 [Trichuris suis]|uniref:MULE transposase domain-containing protein n=1 Tax=Trichuris suis TaxID=68888 RepID=A0A085LU95_9BILA|nr:hypothetical protein M513_10552 [Trichuris suis]KFD71474.1 hypothetical protein M514_10552 [Trichuris suis]
MPMPPVLKLLSSALQCNNGQSRPWKLRQLSLTKLSRARQPRQRIRRRRGTIEAAPPQPLSRASIVLPERYTMYSADERFLLYDSGHGDEDRILVFGREAYGAWCGEMKVPFVDGTFSVAPSLFAQVFVVMAKREGFVLPVLYALVPNKQETTYLRTFEAIKETWPDLAPESISMDYELALVNAVRAAFPAVRPSGCFFHLTRSMKRHLAEECLLGRYSSDPEFALQARMIVALAFVPLGALDLAFQQLAEQSPPALHPLLA